MLNDYDLFEGEQNKIEIAIERLKMFEPPEGYYLTFSGGKDSIVIKKLADLAGVKYDAHFHNTTIEYPETYKFIRKYHPDVIWDNPDIPFLHRMANIEKYPPFRHQRWCCKYYKEQGGSGRLCITGVRWAESSKRRKRRMSEVCMNDKTKKFLHVIIDWTDKDVWEFIHKYNLPYCKLYDNPLFHRIGCVLCPMDSKRAEKIKLYPKWEQAFRRAFRKMVKNSDKYKDGDEWFEAWINNKKYKEEDDHLVLFE